MSHNEEMITKIANEVLNIESLETQNSDDLDFHNVAVLKWDVYSDDYECPKAVDLLEGDVIEWEFLTDDVEITIREECFSVGEASGRGGSIFTVPKDKFVTEYKPALSNS